MRWGELLLVVLDMVAKWWRSCYRRRRRVTRVWVMGVRLDFEYSRREGFRLVAWALLEDGPGGRRAVVQEEGVVPKKPAQGEVRSGEVRQILAPPKLLEKLPTLRSYLLDMDYEEGGGPREVSYYTVRPTPIGWAITLKDPSTCRQLRVTVADLGTALAALDALLGGDSCPWEPDQWAEQRQPRKGKKK